MFRRAVLFKTILLLSLLGVAASAPAFAETIAVIGTGRVGGALGPQFAALEHNVVYGSRRPDRPEVTELVARTGHDASASSPKDAAAEADIVVLAVPGLLVQDILRGLGNLSGKIIIDPTNPIRRGQSGLVELAVETSNTELIQELAPSAHVVKAFNTLSWEQMADPGSSEGPISIPLAGDSEEAKAAVAELVEGIGFEPIDVGPVQHARYVEGMLIIWINNRYVYGEAFEFHLRKLDAED